MRISDQYERFVDRTTGTGAAQAPARVARAGEAAATAEVPGGEPKEKDSGVLSVTVSGKASDLSDATARVEKLKTAIREGTFKVDARAIAKALVGEEDEP